MDLLLQAELKKAEHWKSDVLKSCCWRKLLKVPWTTRRWNQSTLKEINPEYSLEGLLLKLKLQYFGNLMQRASGKTLMLGKIEGRRRRDDRGWDGWMASPTRWTWVWVSSRSWWWTGRPGVLQSMGSKRVRRHLVTELNWTEKHYKQYTFYKCHELFAILKISISFGGEFLMTLGTSFNVNDLPLKYLDNTCDFW